MTLIWIKRAICDFRLLRQDKCWWWSDSVGYKKVWLVTFNMLDLWPSAWSLLSWQKNLRFPACLCPINTLLFLPLVDKWKPGRSLFSSLYLHAFALSLISQFHYCLSPGCLWLESNSTTAFQLSLVLGLQNSIFTILRQQQRKYWLGERWNLNTGSLITTTTNKIKINYTKTFPHNGTDISDKRKETPSKNR